MRRLFLLSAVLVLCAPACFSPVIDHGDGGLGGGGGQGGGTGGAGGGGGSITGGGNGNGGGVGTGGGIGGGFGTGGGNGGGFGTGGGTAGGSGLGGGGGGRQDGGSFGCASDAECGKGSVCMPAGKTTGGPAFQCVPGCRGDSNCASNEFCQLGVVCIDEPCAPGQCLPRPVNDGGQACSFAQPACNSPWACGFNGKTCLDGCCQTCPLFAPPPCKANEVLVQGGINPVTGCQNPPKCVPGGSGCPTNVDPVCSTEYATFSNLCELQNAGAQLMHSGECLEGEGMYCEVQGTGSVHCGDGTGQFYCRDTCPQCGSIRVPQCTKIGACVYAWDCQHAPELACPTDGGTPGSVVATCVNNACQYHCQ